MKDTNTIHSIDRGERKPDLLAQRYSFLVAKNIIIRKGTLQPHVVSNGRFYLLAFLGTMDLVDKYRSASVDAPPLLLIVGFDDDDDDDDDDKVLDD